MQVPVVLPTRTAAQASAGEAHVPLRGTPDPNVHFAASVALEPPAQEQHVGAHSTGSLQTDPAAPVPTKTVGVISQPALRSHAAPSPSESIDSAPDSQEPSISPVFCRMQRRFDPQSTFDWHRAGMQMAPLPLRAP